MATRRTSIYLSEPVLDAANVDEGGVESFSGRLGFLVTSAARCAAEATPALAQGVWLALIDANNGTFQTYEAGERAVIDGMLHNLADSAPENNDRFGVDCVAGAREIAAMPFAQRFAVFELVRLAWTARGRGLLDGAADWSDGLRKLGAKIKP